MDFSALRELLVRSSSFRWATLFFWASLAVDIYIVCRFGSVIGTKYVCMYAFPIGLQLPVTWWRLAQCVNESRFTGSAGKRVADGDADQIDLSSLSFWLAFIPLMSLLFLLSVLGRGVHT